MELPVAELSAGGIEIRLILPEVICRTPSSYLSAKQRDGKPLGADEIYKETWKWLEDHGCEKFVSNRLVEGYTKLRKIYTV